MERLAAAADVLERLVRTRRDGDRRVTRREGHAEPLRTTFRALRNRNFRLFFSGQLISQAGTWLTTIALTLLVLDLTHSGVAIGLLVACQFGPVLLFGAWGGLVADRSDKRRLLLITQTLEMGQSFALAALAFMHQPPVAAFYVVALAGGFMLAFDNPARRSFVAEMVPEDEVQNAVTLNSALMTSSRVIGPAIAGMLVVTVGFGWCFLIDAVSYLAVIASLLMMRRADLRQPPVVARARGQLRAALRYIRDVPDLWIPLVMMTVIGTLTFNFAVVIPLFVEHTLHGSNGSFTLLYSVLSVGSVIGALAAAQIRVLDTRHVVYAAFAFGAAMFVLAAAPTLLTAFPIARVRRAHERRVHHRVDRHRAGPGRAVDARARPRAAGHGADRQHPDRRPAARIRLRRLRRTSRDRARRGRRGRRRRLGLRHAPADRGVPRRRRHPRGGVGPLDVGLIAAPPP